MTSLHIVPVDQNTTLTSHFRILATSDVHMAVTGFDERGSPAKPTSGLTRLSGTISDLRQNAPGGCLLLDNGDILQGDPLAETALTGPCDKTHPLVRAMHHLGYDAMGLGNHDFDFGTDYLREFCAALKAPVLCANLEGWADDSVRPHCLISRDLPCSDGTRHSLRIGLTSALPAQTAKWNARWLGAQVTMTHPVEAVRRSVEALRAAGADLVIVLAHTGIAPKTDNDCPENFAMHIAELDGVDAIIAGHTHLQFPGPDHGDLTGVECETGHILGVPCVMPGTAACRLGRIDLTLARSDDGAWSVTASAATLDGAETAAPDDTLLQDLAPARAALHDHLNEPLGEAPHEMHGYFALLRGGPSLAVMGRAMIRAMACMALPEDLARLPRLATVYPSLSGGRAGPSQFVHIAQGPVTRRTALDLAPYEDTLELKRMTGADLRLWLDRSAAIFTQLGADTSPETVLHIPDMPGFNFDMFYGLQVRIDPGSPARFQPNGQPTGVQTSRVAALLYNGQEVADHDAFLVAMGSYRASGGGQFPAVGQLVTPPGPAIKVREVAADGIRSLGDGPLDPLDWRLTGGTGQHAIFHTSPAARAHLGDIADLSPEDLGVTETGFLKLRILL